MYQPYPGLQMEDDFAGWVSIFVSQSPAEPHLSYFFPHAGDSASRSNYRVPQLKSALFHLFLIFSFVSSACLTPCPSPAGYLNLPPFACGNKIRSSLWQIPGEDRAKKPWLFSKNIFNCSVDGLKLSFYWLAVRFFEIFKIFGKKTIGSLIGASLGPFRSCLLLFLRKNKI